MPDEQVEAGRQQREVDDPAERVERRRVERERREREQQHGADRRPPVPAAPARSARRRLGDAALGRGHVAAAGDPNSPRGRNSSTRPIAPNSRNGARSGSSARPSDSTCPITQRADERALDRAEPADHHDDQREQQDRVLEPRPRAVDLRARARPRSAASAQPGGEHAEQHLARVDAHRLEHRAVGDRRPDERAEPRALDDDVDREREREPDADQRQPVDRIGLPGDADAAVEAAAGPRRRGRRGRTRPRRGRRAPARSRASAAPGRGARVRPAAPSCPASTPPHTAPAAQRRDDRRRRTRPSSRRRRSARTPT